MGKIVCGRRLEKEEVGPRKWKKPKSFDWADLLILDPKRKPPTATALQLVPEVSLMGSISKPPIINKQFPSVLLLCTHFTQFSNVTHVVLTTVNGGSFCRPRDLPGVLWGNRIPSDANIMKVQLYSKRDMSPCTCSDSAVQFVTQRAHVKICLSSWLL